MEDIEKLTQYGYKANANLVLNAEKRPRDLGPTGEVLALPEATNPKDLRKLMGVRAVTTTPAADSDLRKRVEKRRTAAAAGHGSAALQSFRKASNVLDVDVSATYEPRTQDTKRVFANLMALVNQLLGGQSHAVVHSACEEVLAIVKGQEGGSGQAGAAKAGARDEIARLLNSPVDDDKFRQILSLSDRISDFQKVADTEDAMDEDLGVAVVFQDEDQDGEEDVGATDLYEVQDLESEAEDEAADGEAEPAQGPTLVQKEHVGDVDADGHGDLMQDDTSADMVNPKAIDAFWLQRQLSTFISDPVEAQAKAEQILAIFAQAMDVRAMENAVVRTIGFENFAFVKVLLLNWQAILWCTRLARAKSDADRARLEDTMFAQPALRALLQSLQVTRGTAAARGKDLERSLHKEAAALKKGAATDPERAATGSAGGGSGGDWGGTTRRPALKVLDLQTLTFQEGGHFMSNSQWVLPKHSWKKDHKGYQEIFVPAPAAAKPATSSLVAVTSMPKWSQAAFGGLYKCLNPVQSRVYRHALLSAENLLLCAPTGAGKTNVAMLCVLREIGLHLNKETGECDLAGFKIVYVAPMKSLVREMVGTFSARLKPFGVSVRELSGDTTLSREELRDTQILVTTPEKWDIVTRKSGYAAIASLVKLIVVDEIHLLHDGRGPVLEAIISRTVREIEQTQEMTRIVGLSATLPNYDDVAEMLRVSKSGLFVFDHTFRPCPLQQIYIGVTAKRPFKQYQMMNELCWERVREQAGKNQVLVFVHSRKDTATTARFLRDKAQETDALQFFVPPTSGSMAILLEEARSVQSQDLKDLIPTGFGIHHAGLSVTDRRLVEDLFAEGHLQVLVSTATLAWGVNLPAHSVIIKGTQVYSPELGKWTELSMLDVMQMLGRAGRPQFDTYGEGTILTTHKELKFYMSLLNEQLPVESQLLSRLPDALNAEIVLGTVRSAREASQWLTYTYLYVRMKNAPHLYGLTEEDVEDDPTLEQRRLDLVHSAATILDRAGLVQYERKSGVLQSTELGRVASHYYLSYRSMSTFSEFLKPIMSDIDLLRVFSLSEEFRQIGVRDEEKVELARLCDKVPIPVKQTLDEPSAKVNILLQAYISRLSMEGYALLADLVYVTQSAGRLMRALFEICLRRNWADNAVRALRLCQMVDHRMWAVETPLRQFSGKQRLPPDVLRKLEKTHLPWDTICDLEVHQIGELIRLPKLAKQVHRLVHMIPKLDASATFQPVTRTTLRIDLTLTGDFQYDPEVHGPSQSFWVLVVDQDEEQILHHELFVLRGVFVQHPHTLSFTVPILEPMAPQYFIRVLSDRWLGSSTILPLSFRDLILPDRFAPPTELLDLQPLPVADLADRRFIDMYDFGTFNAIQTQVFPCLYHTDQSAIITCPTGSGKTACAEFALFRMLQTYPNGRAVYLAPNVGRVQATLARWIDRLGSSVRIGLLTGDLQSDLQIFTGSQVVLADPTDFDALSRKWRSRPVLQNVNLVVIDDCHFLGASIGPVMEVVVSRIRFISKQLDRPIRIVALGAAVANAADIAQWCGVAPKSVFTFGTTVRPVPIEIAMCGIEFHGQEDRMQAMVRPAYTSFVHSFDEKTAADPGATPQIIVFAPSRQHARRISAVMVAMASGESPVRTFLRGLDADELERQYFGEIANVALRSALFRGVGFLHSGLSEAESGLVRRLFEAGAIGVVVVAHDLLYDLGGLRADHVTVLGSQYYDGVEKKLAHYSIVTVEAMVGACGRQGVDGRGIVQIYCHRAQSAFYAKFLLDAFPVESHLDTVFGDHLNAEIVNGTVRTVQEAVDYLTWTFLYRRLARNPNYYSLKGTSHRHLSDYLSELVENAVDDLSQSEMVALDQSALSPLNLGMIAAHYYLKYMTIEMFAQSLSGATRLKGVLNLVSAAAEFDTLPVRRFEEKQLQELAKHLRLAPPPSPGASTPLYYDSHTKAHLLLQAHFSRLPLSGDVRADLRTVLPGAVRLVQAMVDVISSQGWLLPALQAMDVAQMIVQGVWVDQPGAQLMQLPHFDAAIVRRCVDAGVVTIDALVDLTDDARDGLVQLDAGKMADVAAFCNRLPNLTVEVTTPKAPVPAGSRASLQISIEREHDDDDGEFVLEPVLADLYPRTRLEGWWLVLGDHKDNKLVAIKKVVLGRVRSAIQFDFVAPSTPGTHHLLVYAVCDSYVGADQQIEVVVQVTEAEPEDDDEDYESAGSNNDKDEMQTDE